VVWEREHDAHYPRDKYRDLRDYFGGRVREEGDRLVITRVRPEDKGVYRCYARNRNSRDFQQVHFYPKYPLDGNPVSGRDC